jgi:hypothetical protein
MNAAKILDELKSRPLAVVCAVLALVFGLLIFFRGGIGEELAQQEIELTKRLRTIERNAKAAVDLQEQLEQLSGMVEQVDSGLFNRDERAVNINFFYGFEDLVDVVISSISQAPEPDAIYRSGGARELKLHSTLVFNLSVRGSFEDILLFCYELYRADPHIRVADLSVSGERGQAAESGLLNASLRVIVLSEKESK